MTLLFPELQEKLKQLDEITILEILDISAEELIERFYDKIEDRFDKLEIEFED